MLNVNATYDTNDFSVGGLCAVKGVAATSEKPIAAGARFLRRDQPAPIPVHQLDSILQVAPPGSGTEPRWPAVFLACLLGDYSMHI